MSILVVGISHKSAPLSMLEKVALDADGVRKLVRRVLDTDHVRESTVLATCNRIEVYAEVDRFHGSVEDVSALLCEQAGQDLVENLYVHYDDAAVSQLLHVTSGLDSMVVGENQILGQTREALRIAQEVDAVGPALNLLFQQALRVGKRSHAETGIDRAAPSVVSRSLARAAAHVGPLQGRRVLVVGAGSLAVLAVSTARGAGAEVVVANRTAEHARRLAESYGGSHVPLSEVSAELTRADVLVACTGATSVVVGAEQVAARGTSAPLAVVDLALPHDVDPAAADLPGVALITLATLAEELRGTEAGAAIEEVRTIVADELAAFLAARHSASVTPTVVALRTMATGVVDSELSRLLVRLPDLEENQRLEIENTLRRTAEKLLHQPTVRVRELVNDSGAISYAAALAELFALDQDAVDAVTRVEVV